MTTSTPQDEHEAATADMPSLSDEEAKARDPDRIHGTWDGRTWWVDLAPHNWIVEREAVLSMEENGGASVTRWLEEMFERRVDDASITLANPHRQGKDPDLLWTIARECGFLERYQEMGFNLVGGGLDRDVLQQVVRQVLDIDRRLRRAGYNRDELANMPADRVRELYELDMEQDEEQARKTAEALAGVLAQRMSL